MPLTQSEKQRLTVAVAIAAVAVAVCVYTLFDPQSSHLFPRCPFRMLTGYDCPGCGTQRGLHALLHGDVVGAMRYNFLMVASLPFILLLLVCEFGYKGSRRLRRLRDRLNSTTVIWIVFAVIIAWWIGRNLYKAL